jgi:hypothetical protein
MGDGGAFEIDLEHRLAGVLGCFLDRGGHFVGFAVADANTAATIAGDDQCAEAESAPTLDDLGAAIDTDDGGFDSAFLAFAAFIAIATSAAAAALSAASTASATAIALAAAFSAASARLALWSFWGFGSGGLGGRCCGRGCCSSAIAISFNRVRRLKPPLHDSNTHLEF